MAVISFRGKDAAYLMPALREVEVARMGSRFEHMGIEVSLDTDGLFCFVVDGERVRTKTYEEAKAKIAQMKKRSRVTIKAPCWLTLTDDDERIEVAAGFYCGIHSGWSHHTFRLKGDTRSKAADSWRGGQRAYRNKADAERYVKTIKEIARLREYADSLGFRLSSQVPRDYDKKRALEDGVVAFLDGKGERPGDD